MITRKLILFGVIFIMTSISALAQEFGLGCVYDPEVDGKVPLQARLETRDFKVLPKAHSLKPYCPVPKSQSKYGSCSAWSTAYAARTICEAMSNGWTNKDSITAEAFSPMFLYRQLYSAPGCEGGVSIAGCLDIMKSKGVPKFRSFSSLCADYVPVELFTEATTYKIDGYQALFRRNSGTGTDKVALVKKALSENQPVVMAMDVYNSFSIYDKDFWSGEKDVLRGSHALCVVGYDDEKYGGAFEIMNSWGDDYAAGGFVWLTYSIFQRDVDYAYNVILNRKADPKPLPKPVPDPVPKPVPDPKPVPKPVPVKKYSMSGELEVIERDGGGRMGLVLAENGLMPHYAAIEEYPSGKRFRLSVGNNEPAWMYVIASDMQNSYDVLFPYASDVSAYFSYKSAHVAIPDESHEFELDATPGTDFFCVLYSQEELDINNIVSRMKAETGSFYERLKRVMGDRLASGDDVKYVRNTAGFSAKSDNSVVPLVLEIGHCDIRVDYKR